MTLPDTGSVQVQVTVSGESVTVHTRVDGVDVEWILHATATVGAAVRVVDGPADLVVWPPSGAQPVAVEGFYPHAESLGYHYGPVFQGLRAVWRDGGDVYAEVMLPDGQDAGFGVHPALLDAALHAMILTSFADAAGQVRLPFAWSGVTLHATGATALRVRVSSVREDAVSVLVADGVGQPVLEAASLVTRPVSAQQLAAGRDRTLESLFRLDVVPVVVPVVVPALDGDVVLRAPETVDVGGAVVAVLERVQRWLVDGAVGRLVVVVRAGDVGHAAVGGLVRSVQAEQPGRVVLVELDGDDESLLGAAVACGEPQVLVRGGGLFAPRLVRASSGAGLIAPVGPWRLDSGGAGTLEALALVPAPQAAAGLVDGQLRLSVRAAGLNFRDVLVGLGMVPDQVGMGGEGAGVVTEVGPGVSGFAVGDRVFGIFRDAFAPVVVVDHRMVVRMPVGWSFEVAASVPVVFVTAMLGLRELGGVRAGERVLVHAAAGGVGMAAVQLLRYWGAEVYATASPGKWDVLRGMGFDDAHVASSRDAGFVGKFPRVDVVLNSLAGSFVDASLGMLRPGGRFLEMGKTDIRDRGVVEAAFPGVSYQAYDLLDPGPARVGGLLADVVELFRVGVLRPVPVMPWDVRRAAEAFRFMSQARHVGKLVLSMPRGLDPDGAVLVVGGTGTLGAMVARHLVTGYGVRRLTLTSRRGLDAPGADDLRAELEGLGAEVSIVACDAADRVALASVLDAIPVLTGVVHAAGVLDDGTVESLTAERVAAVLRPKVDAVVGLEELTAGRDVAMFTVFSSVAGVFGTAGQGNYAAANAAVDALMVARRGRGLPGLSLAWGYWSRDSGMTGHLDGADRARIVRTGLRPLSDADGLALFDAAHRVDESVLVPVALDIAVLQRQAEAGMLPAQLRGLVRAGVRRVADALDASAPSALAQRIAGLSDSERDRLLLDVVLTHTATVLGHSSTRSIRADRGFLELGFDSLTAVELRNRLNAATGLTMPATLIFDHPSPAALARHVGTRIRPAERPAGEPVLSELERFGSLLTGSALDDPTRRLLGKRLRTLLRELDDAAGEAPDDNDDVRLDGATDEQMFALIDKELGRA
ncbi:SDR family NAD(P)-dependent oxidoreductase [Paractinoplanes durhamensis]